MPVIRPSQRNIVMLSILVLVACFIQGCADPKSFSFILTADARFFTPPDHAGPNYFAGVCEAIRDVGPGAFMASPGDVEPPDRFRKTLDDILGKDYPWYPVVGNHELDKPEYMAYLRKYNTGGRALPNIVRGGPPGAVETCYSFDYGNAHFVAINQYYDGKSDAIGDGDICDALLQWLADDLAENKKPLVFVLGHEPTVVMPDIGNGRVRHVGGSLDKYPEHNHRFWSLLRKHNTLAYFCGHTHNTSVSKINGVWQIDCGHARGIGDPGAASTFIKMIVEATSVRCEVYRRNDTTGKYHRTYSENLR